MAKWQPSKKPLGRIRWRDTKPWEWEKAENKNIHIKTGFKTMAADAWIGSINEYIVSMVPF